MLPLLKVAGNIDCPSGSERESSTPMLRPLLLCASALAFAGCIHVTMDPIQVHAVVDVNVKMEKAVTDVLSEIYGDSTTVNTDALPAATP